MKIKKILLLSLIILFCFPFNVNENRFIPIFFEDLIILQEDPFLPFIIIVEKTQTIVKPKNKIKIF